MNSFKNERNFLKHFVKFIENQDQIKFKLRSNVIFKIISITKLKNKIYFKTCNKFYNNFD